MTSIVRPEELAVGCCVVFSAEFLQLLGCTYTRMNDIPTLLASLGEHLGVTAMTSGSFLTLKNPAASQSNEALTAMQQKLGGFARAGRSPRKSGLLP